MRKWVGVIVAAGVLIGVAVLWAQTTGEVFKAAVDAAAKGETNKALKLAAKAIEMDPKNPRVWYFRASVHETLGQHKEAIADYTRSLELDPKQADALDRRGSEKFKLGDVAGSLADFDKFVELMPEQFNGHWKRGISCYYAGKFEEGAKQFKGYEKVDTNDVENAVWHYLCEARASSPEKARAMILKIGNDRRVPMMQVYALFAGKAKPDDVLAAANDGQPEPKELNARLFYAHLYLGLYWEVEGDKKKAMEHLTKAADDHKIGHYMWDVARVHRDLLASDMKPK